jgi:hypothetical protein
MNPMTWAYRRRPTARRRRSTRLTIEPIEQRLAPSSISFLPPSQSPILMQSGLPNGQRQHKPYVQAGPSGSAVDAATLPRIGPVI